MIIINIYLLFIYFIYLLKINIYLYHICLNLEHIVSHFYTLVINGDRNVLPHLFC